MRNQTGEFAIIATYADGSVSVHYCKGTLEQAKDEALSTQRIAAAESVTYARVCGFVDCDGEVSQAR